MNEVSIIINGVRYDAVDWDKSTSCGNQCELDCDKYLSENFVACCQDIIGYDRIFKKFDNETKNSKEDSILPSFIMV